MRETFEKMIAWVHADEGEYSNDPKDPGGPTRLGITYKDLARYRGIPEKSAWSKVRGMKEDEVKAIYRKFYWDPLSCDDLPIGVDYFLFDSGLLSGIGTAAKWLQRSVGATPDGEIGPKTLAALDGKAPAVLLGDLVTRRRASLKSLSLWRTYGKGWTNRVNKSRTRAVKLIGIPS